MEKLTFWTITKFLEGGKDGKEGSCQLLPIKPKSTNTRRRVFHNNRRALRWASGNAGKRGGRMNRWIAYGPTRQMGGHLHKVLASLWVEPEGKLNDVCHAIGANLDLRDIVET